MKRAAGIMALVSFLVLASWTSVLAAYPEPKGNVNDYVGILTDAQVQELESFVDVVLSKTGATFAVAIVPDLGGETAAEYAVHLFEAWGIGKAGDDRGLLILLSTETRDVRAEVGYGLEPDITDARAGRILDEMLPFFRDEKWGDGFRAGLEMAAGFVGDEFGTALVEEPTPSPFPLYALGLLVGLPIALFGYLGLRARRCPRCGARMSSMDRVVAPASLAAGGIALRILMCPRCGYREERERRTPRLRAMPGGRFPMGPGPMVGGGRTSGRSIRPRGFGGGRSGGGGAGRKF